MAVCIVCKLNCIWLALINSSIAQHDCPGSFFYCYQLALMTTLELTIIFVAPIMSVGALVYIVKNKYNKLWFFIGQSYRLNMAAL